MFDFQSETVVPIHLSLAWTRGCLSSNAFFYVWFWYGAIVIVASSRDQI